MDAALEIFLVTAPGLEDALAAEARAEGFEVTGTVPGGVGLRGDRATVVAANLRLRCAARVLVRIASFRAMHLAQLDKRARKVAWSDWLRPDTPVRIESSCRKSRIYHAKAATQRVARALAETLGCPTDGDAEALRVLVRIEDDLCTISLDTSGESLHRRGAKSFVGKAPMRETMAAAFLRQAGWDGQSPVLDPMCGSGTFVLEAAERAAGLWPGRARDFAFGAMAGDWPIPDVPQPEIAGPPRFFGSDRDQGAVAGAAANAERAGVAALCRFERTPVSEIAPPEGLPPGLVIVNPPYGARIGNRKLLFGLYGSLGSVLKARFAGWRVGIVTSDGGLAKATGLALTPGPVVDHSGTKVRLYTAPPL